MANRWCLGLIVALGAPACVFDKGPGAALGSIPNTEEPPATDGGAEAAQTGSAGRPSAAGEMPAIPAGASGSAGTLSAGAGGADALGGTSAGDGGRADDRDASVVPDSGAGDDGTDCGPAIAACNPVTNEGCPDALGMHCAVDPAARLTGYCIFSTAPTPSPLGDCLNTGITESCPPTSTCRDGQCRELCLCDADCEAGQCCREPIESTGFKVCGEC